MKSSIRQTCLCLSLMLLTLGILGPESSAATAPLISSLGRIEAGLKAASRLDLDAAGNLYVADPRAGKIIRIDPYGRVTGEFAGAVPSTGAFTVTADGSRLYVATAAGIAVMNGRTGALEKMLPLSAADLGAPSWMDLDSAGFLYVADGENRVVKVVDPQGMLHNQFGLAGASPFASIFALRVDDSRNEVYVADALMAGSEQPAVHVFDPAGTPLRKLLAGSAFGSPAITFFGGLTFDEAGRAYFLDQHRSEIRILELPGRYLSSYAKVGYQPGQLTDPADVAYDPTTKRLFVLCGGDRIEILGIDGGTNPVRVNVVPSVPRPLSPVAGSEAPSARPELVFTNSVNSDGDPLTYRVELLRDGQTVASYADIAEGEGTTTVAVASALAENAGYQWKAQAWDGWDVSGWSELQTFYVNAVEEPPAAPRLIAPLAGESLDGKGLLSWEASVDPDPSDTVSYVLEIAAEPEFTKILLTEVLDGTALVLGESTGYPVLEDGTDYWWRVVAVDNHQRASSPGSPGHFVYDTSELQVSASLPGASVFLGGDLSYPGIPLGEAPVKLRDLGPGDYSIVVERPGAETSVTQIHIGERENVGVHAILYPALSPEPKHLRPLDLLQNAAYVGASPFAVDFDLDGNLDLLLGRSQGGLLLFRGLPPQKGEWVLEAGSDLQISAEIPFAADWDNDGRRDLVSGSADGSVRVFFNTGSARAPSFGSPVALSAGAVPLQVTGPSVPVVLDFDGNGKKDLVVGAGSGEIFFFANSGSDEAPRFETPTVLKTASAGPVSPSFIDWDADGRRDLLVAADGAILLYPRLPDGSFGETQVLLPAPKGNGPRPMRLFAADVRTGQGKDLLVGTEAGLVLLAPSEQKVVAPKEVRRFTPTLKPGYDNNFKVVGTPGDPLLDSALGKSWTAAAVGAARDKILALLKVAAEKEPAALGTLDALLRALERGEDRRATALAQDLLTVIPEGSPLAAEAKELAEFIL